MRGVLSLRPGVLSWTRPLLSEQRARCCMSSLSTGAAGDTSRRPAQRPTTGGGTSASSHVKMGRTGLRLRPLTAGRPRRPPGRSSLTGARARCATRRFGSCASRGVTGRRRPRPGLAQRLAPALALTLTLALSLIRFPTSTPSPSLTLAAHEWPAAARQHLAGACAAAAAWAAAGVAARAVRGRRERQRAARALARRRRLPLLAPRQLHDARRHLALRDRARARVAQVAPGRL